MMIIKIDCCGHPQMLCSLSIWMSSDVMWVKGLNIVHPTIKFTSDISDREISFLDLTIYIKQSTLHTRLYTKPTDRHMYLNYLSEHPMSLKTSRPYSQFLRLKKIHSETQYLLESHIHRVQLVSNKICGTN